MKLHSTIAFAFLSLGMLTVQLPATASNKTPQSSVRVQKDDFKKSWTAALHRSSSARSKSSEFFQRMARKPKEFFERHTPQVRLRNEGVPVEAAVNVPRPEVSENSIF